MVYLQYLNVSIYIFTCAALMACGLSWRYKSSKKNAVLVGGFNPLEKYARQIGSSPQGSGKLKKYLSCHHQVFLLNN